MKLYELTTLYRDVLDDPDIPPEALPELLDGIAEDFEAKAVACAKAVLNMIGDAHKIRGEEKRLADARGSLERRAEALKAYVLRNMEALSLDECGEAGLKLKVRLNPAGIIITNQDDVPQGYRRQPPWEPDKQGAAKAMRNGEDVPGFAWGERTKRLEIR